MAGGGVANDDDDDIDDCEGENAEAATVHDMTTAADPSSFMIVLFLNFV